MSTYIPLTSIELNNCLKEAGYDEDTRKCKVETFETVFVLENVLLCVTNPTECFCSSIMGSQAEGTSFHDFYTDVDCLFYNPFFEVLNEKNVSLSNIYGCMIRGKNTPHGYTKLQVYNSDGIKLEGFDNVFHDDKGCNFLLNTNTRLNPSTVRHGPAETMTMSGASVDYVLCHFCPQLPEEVIPWFQRGRAHGWPSLETCELFKKMGCFLVRVGHQSSVSRDLEWRISLSFQEKHLMLNLNPTQYRCYILLKMIKKMFKELYGELISSYHCKTALFYTIEENNQGIWQPENIFSCLEKCLKQLYDWVDKKCCPNFFIPKENMFETKKMNEEFKHYLWRLTYGNEYGYVLNYVLKNIIKMFTQVTQVKKKLLLVNTSLINFTLAELTDTILMDQSDIDTAIPYMKHVLKRIELTLITSLKKTDQESTSPQFLEKALLWFRIRESNISEYGLKANTEVLLQYEQDANAALQANKDILRNTLPLAIQTVQSKLASLLLAKFVQDKQEDTLLQAKQCCENPRPAVYFELLMKIATVHFMMKNYDRCNKALKDVYTLDPLHVGLCQCLNRSIRHTLRLEETFKILDTSTSSIYKVAEQVLSCLSFDRLQFNMVPIPLIHEAFKSFNAPPSPFSQPSNYPKIRWHNQVFIDPFVYLIYLQYMNYKELKDKPQIHNALSNLEKRIIEIGGVAHMDTALNMLGEIYITKGWYRLALQCFRRSWQIQPEINAAKWHVMFMLFN